MYIRSGGSVHGGLNSPKLSKGSDTFRGICVAMNEPWSNRAAVTVASGPKLGTSPSP